MHKYINTSPVFLFGEVLIIFDGHVLLHVEFGKNLRDDDLVALRAVEVEVGGVDLPRLVLLHLLVEVLDRHADVDLVRLRDLRYDLPRVTLQRLEVCVRSRVLGRLSFTLVRGRRVRLVDAEFL